MTEPDRFFETDEPLMDSVLQWAYRRIVDGQDPHATARPADQLAVDLAGSVSPDGIGGEEALKRGRLGGFLVSFDNYYTTHSPENRDLAGLIYTRLRAAGHIARRVIEPRPFSRVV